MRIAELGKFKVKMVLGKYRAKIKIKYYVSIKRKDYRFSPSLPSNE